MTTNRRPMLGFAVYHARELADNVDLLDSLVAASSAATGEPLSFLQGQFASSDRFSRQQKATPANMAQLRTDVRGHVYRSVEFASLRKTEQEASPGYTSLVINVAPARNPRVSSEEPVRYPFREYLITPQEHVRGVDGLRNALTQLVEAFESPYGFIHVGGDFRDVLMELTCTPMLPWGEPMSDADRRREQRLFRCQAQRVQLGHQVSGAYWSQALGSYIVEQLGGRERVLREAPVAVARRLPGGRAYLQLTDELPDSTSSQYIKVRSQLEAYLAPVSVEGGHEASLP